MKRILALILVVILLLSMAACSSKKDPGQDSNNPSDATGSNSDKTDNNKDDDSGNPPASTPSADLQEAEVGTILSRPEIVPNNDVLEDFYVRFTHPDGEMEIAVDQVTDDVYIMYVTSGSLKMDEMIYVVQDDGITRYTKTVFDEGFIMDTTASQSELAEARDNILMTLSFFIDFADLNPTTQYKKCASMPAPFTGDAYIYELLEDGATAGRMYVDQKTGFVVALYDADGTSIYIVQEFKTSGIEIPDYE